ncbi:DsbA family protein [Halolamina sp. CBA1230]|uniref:DsbA family oxidoreductase n=1 Tax=Halolamina sp. CBA1230 TaxID=1853690 RepID=UPI0009A15910|nr:DsbA family protein [Halolamina sp. CBA1230]QKY21305.1 DsbA family protein [Halolamina sp. CBA1230]
MSESDGVVDTADVFDAEADEVVVFSDYVCPFCYLGRESLERYREQRDAPLDVAWHPFDLRGHKRDENREIRADVDDGKDDSYFEQVRENVERLGEKYDVELDIDAVPDTDSWNAQQAAFYVREEHPEQFAAFDDALFVAYWDDHRDIGDLDVIADVAEEADLDAEEVREAATDESWADRLAEQFQEARDRGVTGVPTFAADGHAARGAVPPEQLERLIEGEN